MDGLLLLAIIAELRHAKGETDISARHMPASYGAGYDAGWAEALRWVLAQARQTRITHSAA